MNKFERRSEPQPEVNNQTDPSDPKDPDREKLRAFLNKIASELKREKVPVPYKDEGEMRVDMYSREGISKENIKEDEDKVRELRKKFHENLVKRLMTKEELKEEEAERRAREIEITGENLEMLKTAIFYKLLKDDFIIARSTDYDDTHRHVDNIILNKTTNKTVCALDETTDEAGFREKKRKIDELNECNGATLKYGLMHEVVRNYQEGKPLPPGEKRVKNVIQVKDISHIPLFYFPLSHDLLKNGMRDFKDDLTEISSAEYEIFEHFLKVMDYQIDHFPNTGSNGETRVNLSNFVQFALPKFKEALKKASQVRK